MIEKNLEQFDQIERVTRPSDSTQFFIFNMFGDYILPRGGQIWTNDLLYLLDLLGVGERAARTTLSRMKQRGWFRTLRDGRQSRYLLTEAGREILIEGEKRIFEEPLRDWDGRWHLVVYSLPEKQRKRRNAFRKKLIWFGFGNLAPGTWISPHDRQAELDTIQQGMGITQYVTMFTASNPAGTDLVRRCWDIPALARDYQKFVDRQRPGFEAVYAGKVTLSPEACFRRRFWLTYQFQQFPLKDPHLPAVLLPKNWIGDTARQLFRQYRLLLREGMENFIDQLIPLKA